MESPSTFYQTSFIKKSLQTNISSKSYIVKKTHVKVCCISNLDEAHLAIDAGASAIGLVGPMPSGPGIIPNETIAAIVKNISQPIDTFLLTSETTAEGIYQQYQKVKTSTIQIVDAVPPGTHAALKFLLPEVKIIQVLHVNDEWAMDEAAGLMHHVDALLLDSGNPNLKVKELGGTGRTHNWEISRKIVALSKVPVWLAGGLRPENIKAAIEIVQPYGVDLCSGVRTNGSLDKDKLLNFFNEVRMI